MKISCWLFLLGICSFTANAQDEVPLREANHYLGLQVNQLIRQIFNFGNNNAPINNPYFLTYQVNSIKNGSGINIGFGYTFNENKDGDSFIDRTTTVNNTVFRFGYEKKSMFTKRWLVSWGIDVVLDKNKNGTKTEEKSQAKSIFESTVTATGSGFGPRLALSYAINDKILIGTEANYYFKATKQKTDEKNTFTTIEFDPFTGQPREVRRTESSSSKEKFKNFQFNSPAVIFLIMRF